MPLQKPPVEGEETECTLPLTQWLRCRRKCTQAHTQNPYTSCLHVALMDWFIRQYTVALVGCSSGQLKLCWPMRGNLSLCMSILRVIRVWLALVFFHSLPCSTCPPRFVIRLLVQLSPHPFPFFCLKFSYDDLHSHLDLIQTPARVTVDHWIIEWF